MTEAFPDLRSHRRVAILDAAEEIFATKGFHAAGIADIATLLGIGHGTFYRYFKNKRDIATTLIDRATERFAEVGLVEDPESTETLEDYRAQVVRIVDGWLALADRHPTMVQILFREATVVDFARLRNATDGYAKFVQRFLDNGVQRGFLRETLDTERTAQMLVALIIEGCIRGINNPDRAAREAWRDAGIALMFDGIAVPG